MSRELQPADRLLLPAVTSTLTSLDLAPEDAALKKLAERYARELDAASATAAQADKVLRAATGDPDLVEQVAALRTKLAARIAVEQLGPKLLTCLESLGASPKARSAIRKGGAGHGMGKLAQLRAARA